MNKQQARLEKVLSEVQKRIGTNFKFFLMPYKEDGDTAILRISRTDRDESDPNAFLLLYQEKTVSELSHSNLQQVYELFVKEGYIPVGLNGFAPLYAATKNPEDYYGQNAQQVLDNLRCHDRYRPWKWLKGGIPNPDFTAF